MPQPLHTMGLQRGEGAGDMEQAWLGSFPGWGRGRGRQGEHCTGGVSIGRCGTNEFLWGPGPPLLYQAWGPTGKSLSVSLTPWGK